MNPEPTKKPIANVRQKGDLKEPSDIVFKISKSEMAGVSPDFIEYLGYKPSQFKDIPNKLRHIIFKEDLKRLKTILDKDTISEKVNLEETIRFQHNLGYTIWLQCKGIVISGVFYVKAYFDISVFIKQEQEYQKQIERYGSIIEGTDVGTWEWNVQTGETIFNERWASLLGYTLKELTPLTIDKWNNTTHPEDLERSNHLIAQHFEGKSDLYECEVRLKHKSGTWIWVLDRGKVVTWTPDGKPEWMTGFQQDITQRILKEEEYKRINKRNKLFIEQAPSAIAMLDTEMNYIAVSQRWAKDFNLQNEIIVGKSFYDGFKDEKEWQSVYDACLKGEVKSSKRQLVKLFDGSSKWITWEARPWYTAEDAVGGILMYSADITGTVKAELELQEKQTFLQTILDSIDVGIVSCDQYGKLTLFNKASTDWHGLPIKNVTSNELASYYKLFKTDGVTPLALEEIPLLKALKDGTVTDSELIIAPAQGKPRLVSTNGSQLLGPDGHIMGAVVAMHDITERKEAEEQLRISEESFSGAFNHSAIGMARLNVNGQWLEVNKSLCEIVGYTPEELKKLTFQDITHPDDLHTDLYLLDELIQGKRTHYQMGKRYFHKQGHIIWIILSVSMVKDKDGKPLYFVSQITNITPQKVAQEQLEVALAKLEGILEASTQVSIIGTDTNGIITTFNKGAENLLGYSREEMIHHKTPEAVHLAEELEASQILKEASKDVKGFGAFTSLADGNLFERKKWTYVKKDGSQFPVLLTVTAIKERDKTIGYLGIAADISDIKKAEQEIKALLAVTKDQNERLKNFAHIVSHNLRSHSGNFSMLLKLLTNDDPRFNKENLLPMLVTASDNLKDTIAHLNEVVSLNTTVAENLVRINLKAAIDATIQNTLVLAKESDTEVYNDVSANVFVMGVPAYIESILLNLITNGIKYRSDEHQSYIRLFATADGNFQNIFIKDNGLGIDLKRHGAKLFGMYKTFHGNKDARGIGLFITKNQIEAMNGKIEVESELNKGTTFKICLQNG